MIKFHIVVVPPGGGEAEYSAESMGNRIPQWGEYIQLKEVDGVSFFFVRHVLTVFKDDDNSKKMDFSEEAIVVEVEPIEYELQSESQTRMIERFKNKGLKVDKYVPSGY